LHKNDPVLFTAKANGGGKPKAEIALTEELAAALQHRRAAAPPSVAPPQTTTPAPAHDRWSQPHRQHLAAELEQRAAILAHCQKLMSQRLPDLNDLAVAHLAGVLYNDVKTLF
jgi:hypothetical protein